MSFCTCTCFCFQGESLFLLVGACGVVLDCIQVLHFVLYFFSSCHICFALLGYSCQGEYIFFYMFLVSNCLLTYVYEFFIDICRLLCVFLKSRFYFICLYFFHTYGYTFCLSVLGNIQVDSIKLLSTLATNGQQLGLNLCFVSIIL